MNTQTAQTRAAIEVTIAIANAIKELGACPSGHLYASVMSTLTLAQYERCIDILEQGGMVRRDAGHVLTWIG